MPDDALRLLQRQVDREPGDARAWAALAAELTRLDREEDAMRAAWRAARLDSSSPARDGIAPKSARREGRPELVDAGPWRGRRFGTVRELPDAPPARLWSHVLDLGRGFVAYEGRDALTAVDLATGRVAWSRPADRTVRVRWGFELPIFASHREVRPRAIDRVDPRTGEALVTLSFGDAPEEASLLASEHLLVFIESPAAGRGAQLTTFDLTTGARLGRFETPPTSRAPVARLTADRLLVSSISSDFGTLLVDPTGVPSWRAAEADSVGVIDGLALLNGFHACRAVELATGREVANLGHLPGGANLLCATPGALVIGRNEALVFDRSTFQPLWNAGEDWFGVGTADALFWISQPEDGPCVLVSHDVRTGEQLDRLELHPERCQGAALGLAAGHLVVCLNRPDAPLRVVELLPS